MDNLYAGVVVDQAHPALDKVFHYTIPEVLLSGIEVGMRVLVPFGRSKSVQGYVMTLDRKTDLPEEKLKSIIRLMDDYPLFSSEVVPLLNWMKREYHCLTIEAIRCFIPPGTRTNIKKKQQRVVYLNTDDVKQAVEVVQRRSKKMAAVLIALADNDGLTMGEIKKVTGASSSSVSSLLKRGYIRIVNQETYRSPWQNQDNSCQKPPVLTREQKTAVETINNAQEGTGGEFLLHGVTGSGKTEVYMQVVQKALSLGKQAIVLVPEISLTPQTVGRFKARFGEQVAILHSGLSKGERFDEWRRIKRQEVNIVVGARSAVFAPLAGLGLIVIDEAHEDTYKSELRPRYHAREIAVKRLEVNGGTLLLGSATPSLDDSYRADKGQYRRIYLNNRVEKQIMPQVKIVDMRTELAKGNRSIFSQALYSGISSALDAGEQVILLLNRRGFAQFVSCRSCGHVVKCNNCDVSLTYHTHEKLLKCHYCGHTAPYPSICPECNSRYIKHFGLGTQRVERDIDDMFSGARVLRMDMDTTSRKGSHHRMLKEFGDGKYNILIGTQMVAKGLDFPNVTLVGVIAADTTLNLPEYRSSEKTFQLITQVTGRAGRGLKSGRVVVQTYQPEHYAITFAAAHDYPSFYNREIEIRKRFDYPPFVHLIRILITGEDQNRVVNTAADMVKWIRRRIDSSILLKKGLIDLGAYPAPLERIKNRFRWHVIVRIKSDPSTKEEFHWLMSDLDGDFYSEDLNMALDFNPLSLL